MARKTPKKFHTRCQEEVYRQVKSHLDDLVDEHFDDADHCDFYLKIGSTVLELSIDPFSDDDAVIEVLAFVVQGVEQTFELMRDLLRFNSEVPLGAFSMVGKDIFFSHSFLGRRLPPEQLIEEGRVCVGRPDDCVRILKQARDVVGLTGADCSFFFGSIDYAKASRSMDLFAREVMPAFQ